MVHYGQQVGDGPSLVECEREEGEPAPLAIARALAALEGVRIEELPPLNDAVDTDALAALLQSDATVSFSYGRYRVVATGHDRIAVYE